MKFMSLLVEGGQTTLSKFFVEAVFLGVTAAITAFLTSLMNNPQLFDPQYLGTILLVVRLGLGLTANLADPKLKNI